MELLFLVAENWVSTGKLVIFDQIGNTYKTFGVFLISGRPHCRPIFCDNQVGELNFVWYYK